MRSKVCGEGEKGWDVKEVREVRKGVKGPLALEVEWTYALICVGFGLWDGVVELALANDRIWVRGHFGYFL